MNMLSVICTLLLVGCTVEKKVPAPTPTPAPIKTRPAPYYKPKRMLCNEEIIKVAVIDTGFKINENTKNAKLCKYGHKDFSNFNALETKDGIVDPIPVDNHGHGTNIAGLIQDNAEDVNFCMVILKYYDPKKPHNDNLKSTVRAINYATKLGIKYINYSGGGLEPDKSEQKAVKNFLDKGGQFIAAAGNERSDIDREDKRYYPAFDDARIIVVGNAMRMSAEEISNISEKVVDKQKKMVYVENEPAFVSPSSNYGFRVNRWEYGESQTGFGITYSGTSQATAVATGKILKSTECNK